MGRPSRYWLITDTHFNCQSAEEFFGRPPNWQATLLRNLRYNIASQDVLIHLGDVLSEDKSTLKPILSVIRGRKILVRGNHDRESNNWYMTNGFDFVCDSMRLGTALLSHKPELLADGVELNIHGHFHNSPEEMWEPALVKIIDTYGRKKHKLLAVEHTYTPMWLSDVISAHYSSI